MSRPIALGAVLLSIIAIAAPDAQAPLPDGPRLLPPSQQMVIRESWLEQRHATILPMMRKHNIAMWIVVNEEFHDDPLTAYIAPPRPYAGNRDFFVFVDAGAAGLKRIAITGYSEDNLKRFFESPDEPVPADIRLGQLMDQFDPKTIGLSIGGARGVTRSLTFDTHAFLRKAVGPKYAERFVSAADLIEEYLDTRLADEKPHYTVAVALTESLTKRALSSEVITPGKTTVGEVRRWLYDALGAARRHHLVPAGPSGAAARRDEPDSRGFLAVAPERMVIERGDVVHVDFGITYMGLDTDWQKMAYVLREGEQDVPEGLKSGDAQHQHAAGCLDAPALAPRPPGG